MPPRIEESSPILDEKEEEKQSLRQNTDGILQRNTEKKRYEFKTEIVWKNVVVFVILHSAALYGVYCCFYSKMPTLIFAFVTYVLGGLGITAGAHRLWAHRTYKAKLPLRIFLAYLQSMALQNSIFEWSRDHRVHHKFSETDADPHNAKRGFFFSHMGWLMMKKHPDVFQKGSKIPMDDLLKDPVVYYQKKYYKTIAILCCIVIPTLIPMLFWNESFVNAYFVAGFLKYIVTLHFTWLVNSVAHMWGFKPYDKRINPAENFFVSIGAIGEGFHNYHHTFPQDYATSEFGSLYFNVTKGFIDAMAAIGQVTDRNKISPEAVLQRRKRTGDLADENQVLAPVHEHDY